MKYDDIHPTFREYLGAHEALRRLGFQSKDIFFLSGDAQNQVHCVLRTQNKQLIIACGNAPEGDVEAQWTRVATALVAKEIPEEDFERIWNESFSKNNAMALLTRLLAKGFRIMTGAN